MPTQSCSVCGIPWKEDLVKSVRNLPYGTFKHLLHIWRIILVNKCRYHQSVITKISERTFGLSAQKTTTSDQKLNHFSPNLQEKWSNEIETKDEPVEALIRCRDQFQCENFLEKISKLKETLDRIYGLFRIVEGNNSEALWNPKIQSIYRKFIE